MSQNIEKFLFEKISVIVAVPQSDLQGDQNLFSLGIDSYGYMELITEIEAEYSLTFTEQELVSDQLQTISGIAQVLAAKGC